jgi:hypothetical protein
VPVFPYQEPATPEPLQSSRRAFGITPFKAGSRLECKTRIQDELRKRPDSMLIIDDNPVQFLILSLKNVRRLIFSAENCRISLMLINERDKVPGEPSEEETSVDRMIRR